jgi:hypothetical protein
MKSRKHPPGQASWLGRNPRAALTLPLAVVLAAVACGDGGAGRPESLEDWKEQRARFDETVWADEELAGEYERTLVSLWDALLSAGRRGEPGGKLAILAALEFDTLVTGTPRLVERLDHGIERFEFGPELRSRDPEDWVALLRELAGSGHQLVQSEWHHAGFVAPSAGSPARSRVAVVLHVLAADGDRRIVVEGDLAVEWSERRDAQGNPIPSRIDATGLRMLTRAGRPGFERILSWESPPRDDPYQGIHPLLLYDLDKDGLLDVVMVRSARVLWNLGGGRFREARLLERPYLLTEAGVIADVNGDAHPDLVSTRARGDMVVYLGDAHGRFPGEPRVTPDFDDPLLGPSVITVGDADGDGDLDAWLGQYKPAYSGGQMPSPFYDANDGHPSHLLLNDGEGRFTTATEAAGLAEKRFRRSYAGSLVDLDEDGDLDLLVVSDYSGVDLYHNDGSGHFVDANATLRSDRHLFGMSAAFGDYDLDGRLDFFVAGMASTTARRLEGLGLARGDRPDVAQMRMRMAFGNRLYLAEDGGWREPGFQADVARTGWTWGTTSFDFDNDGDPDIFAANGHQSGESTEDYCGTFWRHDIYDGVSEPDPGLAGLFAEAQDGLVKGRQSWDGYQKNHLLLNRSGRGFVNVAFLFGVADEFDSRSAVSGDFDLDGRVDLFVTEDLGTEGETLHIYRNRLETGHGWIGVRLQEQGGGISPVGAAVTVHTADRRRVGRVVTGETLMGQHAPILHFGLGDATEVEEIEVRWLGGQTRTLRSPAINQYHLVLAPGSG